MNSIKINLNNEEIEIEKGHSLEQLISQDLVTDMNLFMAAKVSGRIVELTYVPQQGDEIKLLDMCSSEGNRTYQRGLMHVFVRACYECLPGCSPSIQHSIASGLYCEIDHAAIDPFIVDKIGKKMREIVNKNERFEKNLINKERAIEFYEGNNQNDKARLLRFREDKQFKLYSCGELSDYYYGHMPPSTGYLNRFRLFYDNPGLVLVYPDRYHIEDELIKPNYPKLGFVFRQSERWASILECTTIADLNEMVEQRNLKEMILANEALHEKTIAGFADEICSIGSRLILVAGPSSSGKTTFTQRLRIQLRVNGKKPAMISLDNYYLNREDIPKQPDGSVDLEAINTIDTQLFNEHMVDLLSGKRVEIPRFNFSTGKRGEKGTGKILQVPENGVLLVEGIHGLNDKLTESVSRDLKFKIYISALTQLNLDRHNRIPTTDVRLIRRIVRDAQHRAASAESTLSMWPSVNAGERKWIFPFQENCDVMFNSTLVYELLILKRHALPLLKSIDESSAYFSEANRIIKFLNYLVDATEENEIPCTSILREFIGGGVFEQ